MIEWLQQLGRRISEMPADALILERATDLVPRVHPALTAAVVFVVGLVLLAFGFRLYRLLVIVAYAAAGLALGTVAGAHLGVNVLISQIVGAVVLGALAWPLHRLGWALVGGVVTALVLAPLARMLGVEHGTALFVIGAAAFLAGAILTGWLLRPLIVVITSLAGAMLLVEATVCLLSHWPAAGRPVLSIVDARPYVVLIVWGVLAVAGMFIQAQDAGKGSPRKPARPAEAAE